MKPCFVGGVGLLAAGLDGWHNSLPVLRGENAYEPRPVTSVRPTSLPASERRRATLASKLALRVGVEALGNESDKITPLFCVFTSGSGELTIVDGICRALLLPDRPVSPTQFHNSVHNAPAGYWSIATGSRAPSVSLSAYDSSFAVGLMEAAITATSEARPVLLLAYDVTAPEPLEAARPLVGPFAVGLLLQPELTPRSLARLDLQTCTDAEPDCSLADPGLEALRRGNPAGRSLPLLQKLATASSGLAHLAAVGATLRVQIDCLHD